MQCRTMKNEQLFSNVENLSKSFYVRNYLFFLIFFTQ